MSTVMSPIRWMVRRDMPMLLDIESRSSAYPWSEEDVLRALRQRNCIGMVVEEAARLRGFAIYALYKRRFEIIKMVVDVAHRRHGWGRQLIEKLKSKLFVDRRYEIACDVRESNLGGQLFLKSQGFRGVEVARGSHENPLEDGYVMQYSLKWRRYDRHA